MLIDVIMLWINVMKYKPNLKFIKDGHEVRCFRYDLKEEGKVNE